jgi:signal peptidase I
MGFKFTYPAVKSSVVKPKIKQHKNIKKEAHGEKNSEAYKVIGNIVTALLLIVMLTLSFFLIQSRLSGGTPAIAGYQMYVVLSGSMNPAFDTGSLVFVKPTEPAAIKEGDIITFSSSSDTTSLTTHRVVGINQNDGLSFVTRGDANNVNDPNPVPAENVVGRVTGSVPYIGYLFGFAQTRQGLIMLIFIPGLFLIIMELRRLFKYMVETRVQQLHVPTRQDSPQGGTTRAGSDHYAGHYGQHKKSIIKEKNEAEDFGF